MKSIEDIYPLTPSQHGLLFHALTAESGETYFEQFHYTLIGPLNEPAFRAAWEKVVARHPALRAAFPWKGLDDTVQVVRDRVKLPWLSVDWSGVPGSEVETRVARYLREDRRKGFALDKPPLMRCALIRQDTDRHHFIWSFHHLLMDGWSFSLVLKDVNALYGAFTAGHPDPLPPAPPFRVALAARQGEDKAATDAYWRDTLAGFGGAVPLMTPPRETPDPADRPGDHVLTLDTRTTERLTTLARDVRVTLNTVLQTAWAILSARHAGTTDVCFGYGTTGRDPSIPGVESIVGMLMTTLPMRVTVDGEEPLRALMTTLARRQALQEEHIGVSLADLQRWAGTPRDGTLFDSVIAFENYPMDEGLHRGMGGLDIVAIEFFERTTFPLVVFTSPANRLTLRLQYDRTRFTPNNVEDLARHLETLLSALTEIDPDSPVRAVHMMDENERRRAWEALKTPSPSPAPEAATIVARLDQMAARDPNAPAIVDGSRRLTRMDLVRDSARLAGQLRAAGVGQGDLVALTLPRSAALVTACLATARLGAAFLPLDPGSATDRNRLILEDATPALLVTPEGTPSAPIPETLRVFPLSLDGIDATTGPAPVSEDRADADGIAYVIHTSGSTGRPKGVPIRHESLAGLCVDWIPVMDLAPGHRVSQMVSPAFDASIMEIWSALWVGATLIIAPSTVLESREALRDWLLTEEIERAFLPTPLLLPLLDVSWPRTAPLTRVGTGGDRLPYRPSRTTTPFTLVNAYGPTEVTVCATAGILAPREDDPTPPDIGVLLPGVRAVILDPHGHPSPSGAAGELCLGGPRLSPGYLNRPDLTAKTFLEDPQAPENRLYRTGDRVRPRPDGRLNFLGRIDRQVKIRGIRVELDEIESVLASHPALAAAVVILDKRSTDALPQAFVEPRPEGEDGTEEDPARAAVIEGWRDLYDTFYAGLEPGQATDCAMGDPDWDLRGWSDSRTGQPIPAEHMRAWTKATLDRLRNLAPRSVLEIGCGSGLILAGLAPEVDRYRATDFAASAARALAHRQSRDPRLARVSFIQAAADDPSVVTGEPVDLVVLNSVVQYFSDDAYLARVLDQALEAIGDGGHLFVGDVRSLPLLDLFHLDVASHTLPPDTAPETRRAMARVNREAEEELALDPRWFAAWAKSKDRVTGLRILPRGETLDTEMSRYRYDVILSAGEGGGGEDIGAWSGLDRTRLSDVLSRLQLPFPPPPAENAPLANAPWRARRRRILGETLRSWIAERLPEAFRPQTIMVLDTLPRTSAGKPDHRTLTRIGQGMRPAVPAQPPQTETERRLAAIWAEVLGLPAVGRDEDFFALGGHSLSTTRVVSRIHSRLKVDIPLTDLFQRPTVAAMAAHIDALAVVRAPEETTSPTQDRETGEL